MKFKKREKNSVKKNTLHAPAQNVMPKHKYTICCYVKCEYLTKFTKRKGNEPYFFQPNCKFFVNIQITDFCPFYVNFAQKKRLKISKNAEKNISELLILTFSPLCVLMKVRNLRILYLKLYVSVANRQLALSRLPTGQRAGADADLSYKPSAH